MHPGHWIHAAARRHPRKTALHAGNEAIAYAELARRVDLCAAALAAAGVRRGEVVAWLGLNSAAMLVMLFACARAGAIFMPLNWRLAPPEHRAMLAEAQPRLLFAEAPLDAQCAQGGVAPAGTRCIGSGGALPAGWTAWPAFLDGARGAAPRPPAADSEADADAPLLLCYTSGSTGRPKGVLLTCGALLANADASVDMHGLKADDRVLTTLPLFHVGGLNIQTTPALREGCTVTLHPKFDPDAVFDAIERDRITLTVLVPAQLDAMFAHPRWKHADFSSLRSISTGSTLIAARIVEAVHARGVPLIQVWGATETCPIASALHAGEAFAKAGSAGRAARGVELRIADAQGRALPAGQRGEILARGRSVMRGYWHDPQATAQALRDGFFHSGDSGWIDAEGYLWVDGRLKDMIISGGENVSPAEVEAVLLECEGVAEAAVVGRPDERWGEAVVAVVVPRNGAVIDRERVLGAFDGRLARFKHPKDLLVVDALPRSALGKVLKDDVRRLVASQGAAR
jgi:fatty-acyl-CoA synthase